MTLDARLLIVSAIVTACAGTLDDPQRFAADGGTTSAGETAPGSRAPADAAVDADVMLVPGDGSAPACGDAHATILVAKCATNGCHSAADRSVDLDLESPDVVTRLSGKTGASGRGLLIDPANPDESTVYTKCRTPPPYGGVMPPSPSSPLDAPTLECLRRFLGTAAVDAGQEPQ